MGDILFRSVTSNECIAKCMERGNKYAGHVSSVCYCANSYSGTKVASCWPNCADGMYTCGAEWPKKIYSTEFVLERDSDQKDDCCWEGEEIHPASLSDEVPVLLQELPP